MMPTAEAKIRAFIALHISEQARETLAQAMARLEEATGNGVRWVNPDGVHLTLKFLGDIPSGQAQEVMESMRKSSDGHGVFHLSLSRLGMFPNERQPRVLWAGVTGDLAALSLIQESVETAMSGLGFQRERRPFRPHLTIGRVRDGVRPKQRQAIGDSLSSIKMRPSQPWQVDSVHLIRSVLLPQGAVYTSLGSAELR